MDKYYYVVTQLPMLFFDRESYMTTEFFLREAEKWLSPADFQCLVQARYNSITLTVKSPRLLQAYVDHENAFRQDIAAWRKAQREGLDYKLETIPTAMVKDGNPLEIEKNLLAFRWKLIEELEIDHHFDLEFLILYFYKLQILETLALYNKEKGLEIFKSISKVNI